MKIKAAVLHEINTPFKIETLDLEEPKKGEVLVEIKAAGVCHSDWHIVTGATQHPLPVVCGHEGAGVVKELGEGVEGIAAGDQVVLNWAPNCGSCFYCDNGSPSLCKTYVEPIWAGTMMDGTTRLSLNGEPVYHYSSLACFANYIVVPQECCIPINSKMPFEISALIGCAVTTGVGAVLNTAKVAKNSSVVVFGAGGVGLSTILGAKYAGAEKIIAVDLTEAKREIALGCGATDYLINNSETNNEIRNLTNSYGADYVFEAVGIPAIQEQCLDAARPGGKIIFSGLSAMDSQTNLPGSIITRQEKTIQGSYYGSAVTARDFPGYAALYLKKELELEKLVSKSFSLEEINEAYQEMLSGNIARGVILFK